MTQTAPLSADFQKASLTLRELLEAFQSEIGLLSQSTSEAVDRFRQDFPRSIQKWTETIERYKGAIRQLPATLRQRPLAIKALAGIEAFEKEIRPGFSFGALQARVCQAAAIVAELEASPTIQKFLHGETVLAGRENLQWPRKLTHLSMGLGFLYLFVYSGWSQTVIWSIAAPFIAWSLSLETARHLNPRVNRWVMRAFGPIMREREKTRVNSAVFYIVSMMIVYLSCPIEVSMLTLLFIAVGDPLAGIVGRLWGRRRINDQTTWEGSIACFAACAGMAALSAGVLFPHRISGLTLVAFSLLGGIIGAAAECSFKKLDDNLVMPLMSAPLLWILIKVFSIL